MTTEHTWIRSSYSGSEGNCVEIAAADVRVAIRDSKDPGGAVLAISPAAWRRFAAQIKD
jgi:hypothetical protein